MYVANILFFRSNCSGTGVCINELTVCNGCGSWGGTRFNASKEVSGVGHVSSSDFRNFLWPMIFWNLYLWVNSQYYTPSKVVFRHSRRGRRY